MKMNMLFLEVVITGPSVSLVSSQGAIRTQGGLEVGLGALVVALVGVGGPARDPGIHVAPVQLQRARVAPVRALVVAHLRGGSSAARSSSGIMLVCSRLPILLHAKHSPLRVALEHEAVMMVNTARCSRLRWYLRAEAGAGS